MATGDRPPSRPSKPPAPKAGGAPTPAKPGAAPARPSTAQKGQPDKVAAAYQDLLAEIVEKKKKAAEVRSRPKKKRHPVWKGVLAVVLPPVAAAVWILDPFAPAIPPNPRPPDERGAWQMALTDAALQIRAWRDSAGRFPADLATARVPLQGVTYEKIGDEAFRLQTFTADGLVAVWMDGTTLGLGTAPPPPPSTELVPQSGVLPQSATVP
ncbi:MAG TPA: hypothetical protein VL295_09465 [Gemmatimonadales bacterium]|nr:hypothetical protein [Gemmatimonadales bacterium]